MVVLWNFTVIQSLMDDGHNAEWHASAQPTSSQQKLTVSNHCCFLGISNPSLLWIYRWDNMVEINHY